MKTLAKKALKGIKNIVRKTVKAIKSLFTFKATEEAAPAKEAKSTSTSTEANQGIKEALKRKNEANKERASSFDPFHKEKTNKPKSMRRRNNNRNRKQ